MPVSESDLLTRYGASPGSARQYAQTVAPRLDAFRQRVDDYNALVATEKAKWGGDPNAFWDQPSVRDAFLPLQAEYDSLKGGAGQTARQLGLSNAFEQDLGPGLRYGERTKGGLGSKLLGYALPVALSLAAPGIGSALGSTLTGATLSGIGGAVGGGLGGAVQGQGLSGILKGAAVGGVGGYLSGGGFSDLLGGTSLGSSGSSLPWLSGGEGGLANAARTAASAAASTPSSGATLPWLTGAGGASAAGGGTLGGFVSGLGDKLTSGVEEMFSTKNLLTGGAKTGLAYALQKDNKRGLSAVQAAATRAAEGFTPYAAGGARAATTLTDLYGLNGPEAAARAAEGFQAAPGYQFALKEGVNALDASAARRGMLLSGNQQRAVQEYGSGLANQYFQQYLQNLQRQAASGQAAAADQGQAGIDAATAFALMKGNKSNLFNQALANLL